MKEDEIWKNIVDYPNYCVSTFGRVKRIPHKYRTTEIILKHQKSSFGYLRVNLYANRKMKHVFVHRLVAMAFIPNIENKPFINHIDCDPGNNHVNNLEWCTQSENMLYSFKMGRIPLMGEKCGWNKLSAKNVKDIRNLFGIYNMRELAEQFNLNKTTVWEIIHRKIWKHI